MNARSWNYWLITNFQLPILIETWATWQRERERVSRSSNIFLPLRSIQAVSAIWSNNGHFEFCKPLNRNTLEIFVLRYSVIHCFKLSTSCYIFTHYIIYTVQPKIFGHFKKKWWYRNCVDYTLVIFFKNFKNSLSNKTTNTFYYF